MKGRWWSLFAFVLAICAVVAFLAASGVSTNAGFKDAASVLTFAGLVAVGIERLIELLWTVLGQAKSAGGWWPLSIVATQAEEFEKATNKLLEEPFTTVTTALTSAKATFGGQQTKLDEIEAQLAMLPNVKSDLTNRLAAAKTNLAPGSPRMDIAINVANQAATFLRDATTVAGIAAKDARTAVDTAASATSVALDIVASFKDNPARKIASLLLGSSMGMLVAGFMGLNVFAAVLAATAGALGGTIGTVLTGVLVGLGANPTHEAIKALQAFKESQNATPTTGVPSVVQASAAAPLTSPSVAGVAAAPMPAPPPRQTMLRATD